MSVDDWIIVDCGVVAFSETVSVVSISVVGVGPTVAVVCVPTVLSETNAFDVEEEYSVVDVGVSESELTKLFAVVNVFSALVDCRSGIEFTNVEVFKEVIVTSDVLFICNVTSDNVVLAD